MVCILYLYTLFHCGGSFGEKEMLGCDMEKRFYRTLLCIISTKITVASQVSNN